jgi:cell wall-associated NlpC family hydrolase
VKRQARTLLVSAFAALLVAPFALAAPGSVSTKQAEARAVMADVQALDANMERAIEAYNLANEKLHRIDGDLRENKRELRFAQTNLRHARAMLSARLVELYTSGEPDSGLAVLLGATSMDDLRARIDTLNRVADQTTRVAEEVKIHKRAVEKHRARLQAARTQQVSLVAERQAQRASVEAQLAQRRQLLSSIQDEISQLQASERERQARLEAEARTRLQSSSSDVLSASAEAVVAPPSSNPSYAPPPGTYGGVVGIAMQYLGVPYVWGGASPSGFDCSGLVMYVYAKVGVSLPHNAAAQYGYGMPVSRDQLQPGDLVFFNGLGHNGIYIGGGQFIHAPHTGDVVKISSLTGWYASTWVGARRL